MISVIYSAKYILLPRVFIFYDVKLIDTTFFFNRFRASEFNTQNQDIKKYAMHIRVVFDKSISCCGGH